MKWRPAVGMIVLSAVAIGGSVEVAQGPASSRAARVAAVERAVWDRYGVQMVVSGSVTTEAQAMADMIAHHSDAIAGSRRIQATTTSPQLAAFAGRLIRVQMEQIEQMESWLEQWYPGVLAQSTWAPMFSTPASTDSDSAYLATMIEHHQHAIAMYSGWVAMGVVLHDELGLLAAHIAKAQEGEIAFMHQLAPA